MGVPFYTWIHLVRWLQYLQSWGQGWGEGQRKASLLQGNKRGGRH